VKPHDATWFCPWLTDPKRNSSDVLNSTDPESGLVPFHVKHVVAAAEYSGLRLDDAQLGLIRAYARWLRSEGADAGGVGPAEGNRLERRHLADSLLFASQFPEGTSTVLDVGSGVGLPGIPLAIALPEAQFVLIDRSGRKVTLMRRAVRILQLENCQVEQGEIERWPGRVPVLVSRASLPPETMRRVADRLVVPGGVAILAGSWQARPEYEDWVTVEIPANVE
jgi:16S rRNA (guanine527-N7)-methyltransferase